MFDKIMKLTKYKTQTGKWNCEEIKYDTVFLILLIATVYAIHTYL